MQSCSLYLETKHRIVTKILLKKYFCIIECIANHSVCRTIKCMYSSFLQMKLLNSFSNRNYDLQKIINHIHFVILERDPPPQFLVFCDRRNPVRREKCFKWVTVTLYYDRSFSFFWSDIEQLLETCACTCSYYIHVQIGNNNRKT